MNSKVKVLAVDDNQDALFALGKLLEHHGFEVCTANSGKEALEKARAESPDIVLLDVMMPEMDGYEVTRRLKEDVTLRYTPVILVTARDSLDDVVAGLDEGADDYIRKPFKHDELLARVRAAMRTRKLYEELRLTRDDNSRLRRTLGERTSFNHIIGESPAMKEVFSLLDKIQNSHVPVLITGESGTGKELVAMAIHTHSPRKEGPFVVQNCSAFNENLLESELFGHVKGAFTGAIRDKEGLFEAADGGTFFLDELGEMSAALQVKLLRVLQDGTFMPVGGTKMKKVDVRIVAATNRNLSEMMAKGQFREDLFYRLNVVNVKLPSLRDRQADIPLLVDHFLAKKGAGSVGRRVTSEAMGLLAAYGWPGNIRELENEIERAVLMSGNSEVIGSEMLSDHIRGGGRSGVLTEPLDGGKLKDALEAVERNLIVSTLEKVKGNKSEAARILGISRSNLIAKAQSYGLDDE